MIATVKGIFNRNREFFLYCAIGLTGVIADVLVFLLLTNLGLDAMPATFLSVSCGILNSFVWNAWLNFQVRSHLLVRFLSFYAVGLIGVVLSVGIIWVGTQFLLAPLTSKVISIPVVVIVQFFLNRLITFRRSPASVPDLVENGEGR